MLRGRTSYWLANSTAANKSAAPLPVHDEFSLPRRAFAVLALLTATGLFAVNVLRIVAASDSLHGLVLLAIFGGMMAADFLSGLIHWSADTWGSVSIPLIGRRLLYPFRVHHVNPDDFLRRRFIDTNGDVAFLVIPVLAAAYYIPLGTPTQLTIGVFWTSFCGIGLLTNQVHQWAHMKQPPYLVRVLQDRGVILGRSAHAKHHGPPYIDNYCIAAGWCNRPLTAIDFFRRLERAVTQMTGWQPRSDEAAFRCDAETRSQGESVIDPTCKPERPDA